MENIEKSMEKALFFSMALHDLHASMVICCLNSSIVQGPFDYAQGPDSLLWRLSEVETRGVKFY